MGEAGYGAEVEATRRGRKIARLRAERDRAADLDAGIEAELARAVRDQRAWAMGAEGERLVAETLATLGRYGWMALHDLHWPGRPLANLDHVAIGPGGVVVIDAKHWSGTVTAENGRLTQNGYDRSAQVSGVADAVAALASLFRPEHRSAVSGAVCLVAQDAAPEGGDLGVTIVGRAHLPAHLASLPQRLSPYDVADIGRHLSAVLGQKTSPDVLTTAAFDRPPPHPRRSPAGSRTGSNRNYQGTSAGRNRRPHPRGRGRRGRSLGEELVLKLGGVIALLFVFYACASSTR